MSEANLKKGIYPDLTKELNPHGDKGKYGYFRLTVCTKIIEKMEKNLEIDTNKRYKKLKGHHRLRKINIFSSAGSSVLSVSGACVSGTGLGAVFGIPIIGVGALLGLTSLVTIALDKETIKKITNYEKLISLGQTKISSIQEMLSKALSDENVTDEEFAKINFERNEYESQRNEILSFSKNEVTLKRSQSIKDLTEDYLKNIQQKLTK